MKRREIIVLLVCLMLLALYLALDLADAAKPLTQFALSPVMFPCMLLRFSPATRYLDVDTAGAAHTTARLFTFGLVQAWLTIPVLIHRRAHGRATAVLKWSALGIAGAGFGFYLFWFVAFALM